MDKIPIIEFYDDVPIITPAKFYDGQKIQIAAGIQTAVCTFLDPQTDAAVLTPILQKCWPLAAVNNGRTDKAFFYQYTDQCLLVLLPIGGAAAVGVIEELKYLGIQNVVVFGTAGLLVDTLNKDTVVLIEKAIRDEGASYHYLAPSVYVATDTVLSNAVAEILQTYAPVVRGTSWTTDALFRETEQRCAKRKSQGAIVVEMECAGMAAAAKRLGMRFCEFVFGSDDLSNTQAWRLVSAADQTLNHGSAKAAWLKILLDASPKIKLPKI